VKGRRAGRVEALSLAAFAVLIAGMAATTTVVYARLADQLVADTQSAIANRVAAVTGSIAAVFSLAADESMNLMAASAARGETDPVAVRQQLGAIQAGLIGCAGAWIVPRGGKPIVAVGTPSATPASRGWWREYLGSPGSERLGTFGNLGIRRNIGFVAAPFRGSTGIGTILPLVVSYYVGTAPIMTAFFEIDMTVILDDLMNSLGRSSGRGGYPMEMSFYDDEGVLVETTRNLPLVRFPPLRPSTAGEGAVELGRSLRDYLFPGNKTIEARYGDDRINLVCVGRVPAAAVMKGVRRVATNVLTVGAAALAAVLILGLMLLQAFRRARSFEKEQLVARLEALQAKVNPHFLFNTLDSMIGVAEGRDYETLMRMIKALSSMLHTTVRRTEDIVSLAEELEYVRAYIAIQEVRYQGGFAWGLEADEAALGARVCRFGIQPLVENCFAHGVHEGSVGMRISVTARAEGGKVAVEVRDDGPGCAPEVAASLRRSFAETRNRMGREGGLFNVHERVRMTFGPPFGLELLEAERGFGIRLTIPRSEFPPGKEGA
jgi:hypothetical protein